MTLSLVAWFTTLFSGTTNSQVIHMKNPTEFVCYYGQPETANFGNVDMIILEPDLWSDSQLASISPEKLVLGYCSIGEVAPSKVSSVDQSLFISSESASADSKANFAKNEEWGSVYVDPENPEWQILVLDRISAFLKKDQINGIFLDTLDMVQIFPNKKSAMVNLVKSIRKAFPETPIVVNRGFDVFDEISSSVDGIVFEGFSTKFTEDKSETSQLLDVGSMKYTHKVFRHHIEAFMKRGGICLTIDYASDSQTRVIDTAWSRSIDYGMVPFISNRQLDMPIGLKGTFRKELADAYGKNAIGK
ncbi:MAG: hypothetical protein JKX97_08530 [Candidatus Lindowbacteria bacterium]|nr:hypothetical protein [Candidatus Lindowbacteria bacterium]